MSCSRDARPTRTETPMELFGVRLVGITEVTGQKLLPTLIAVLTVAG